MVCSLLACSIVHAQESEPEEHGYHRHVIALFTGVAHKGARDNGPALGIEDGEHGSESLLRLGGEYGFEVGEWEIAPQIDLDIVDSAETWVIGVTFGKGLAR